MALVSILSALGESHATPGKPEGERARQEPEAPEAEDDGGEAKAGEAGGPSKADDDATGQRKAPRKASRKEDLAFRVGVGLVDETGEEVELSPDRRKPTRRPERTMPAAPGDDGGNDARKAAPVEGGSEDGPARPKEATREPESVPDAEGPRAVKSSLGTNPAGKADAASGPAAKDAATGPRADDEVTAGCGGARAETHRTPQAARKHLRDRVRRQAGALERARAKVERLLQENEGLRNQVTDGRGECDRLRAALEAEREARQSVERERDRLSAEILDREQAEAERRAQALGLDGRTRTTLPVPTSAATGAPLFFGEHVGIMGQRGWQQVEVDKIQYDRSGGISVSDRNGVGGFVGSWKEQK